MNVINSSVSAEAALAWNRTRALTHETEQPRPSDEGRGCLGKEGLAPSGGHRDEPGRGRGGAGLPNGPAR
jgi:hypothetical protein